MNGVFKTEFERLLADLTKNLRYWNPSTGDKIVPQIIETMPIPPESSSDVDGEYPIICWVIYDVDVGLKPHPMSVLIDFGVKIDESVGSPGSQQARGSAQIKEIVNSLAGMCKHRVVGGYRLQLPFKFKNGDQSPGFEGAQPFPYCHGRLYLSFLPL
ncbi:MAG: hypothetical protein COA36_11740 [Desulfotalea sp.]|nr:MAG: hypothetical protein COA36_11740 [Desulfotalea sp.]